MEWRNLVLGIVLAAAVGGAAAVAVRKSPPEPLTHSTSTGSPVKGSSICTLADVLPPPWITSFGSEPSSRVV